MKAFCLAAGEGRRLRPLTDGLPKCLVPINGVPLLTIWLEQLGRNGVTDVLVNMHHAHERLVEYASTQRTGVALTLAHEPRLLGSAGTVLQQRAFVAGDPRFLIVYSDVLTCLDIRRMVRFHDAQPTAITIGVTRTDRPREKGTVVLGPRDRVTAFEEKAVAPRSDLANAGIYVASQRLFDYLPSAPPDDAPLDFGHDVLPRMVPDVTAYRIQEFLLDIGTPESYAAAQERWQAESRRPVDGPVR